MVALGGPIPNSSTSDNFQIVFEDDAEERAWVAFATGRRYDGSNYSPEAIVKFADMMLVEMRKRRKKFPEDGPYR